MLSTLEYSIAIIKDEAKHLLELRKIDRKQPIYTLCQYIPPREWPLVEQELERNGYLLRDHIIDLLPCETWDED